MADRLPLLAALQSWCKPVLIERLREVERSYTEHELNQISSVPQITPRTERRKVTPHSWMIGDPDYTRLFAAWRDIDQDLRRQIEAEQLYILGVQMAPERRTELEVLPGAWAAEFSIDFADGKLKLGELRYVSIQCAQTRPGLRPLVDEPRAPAASVRLSPESVVDLDDDLILALLEEHHRRVASTDDGSLFPPGKISLMRLIKRRLQARAAQGEILPQWSAEAAALADWIDRAASSQHVPTAKTIENVLRADYLLLRPRSKPPIP